ncbi:OsmC family protein [Streptomyces sp. NPDC018031]|uniref:OsmC family protein n=1 Tax=Streptomyces sp. NPDC018031 TaxID=3365033 RepID=UPI0037A3F5E6
MDHTVTVRCDGRTDLTATNGRAEAGISWGPEPGRWMATELFLTGLGACMLATLADYATTHHIPIEGASVRVEAGSATRPSRMNALRITYSLPAGLSESQVAALVRAGDRCKVHNTLHHRPDITVATASTAAP